MSVYKKLSKMTGNKSFDEKLYELLQTDTYKTKLYETQDLGEGMAVLYKLFLDWYKPWMVINHNKKTAFEFMNDNETLVTVTADDVDWESLEDLPENAVQVALCLSFHYPSIIREFKNGVAEVIWELNPDGRYYMDDYGYGMTSDVEIDIYGFIDTEGRVLIKFQTIKDKKDLDRMRKEAEEIIKGSQSV